MTVKLENHLKEPTACCMPQVEDGEGLLDVKGTRKCLELAVVDR